MKLLRHGPAGLERPGLLDLQGRVRDLSAHVHDLGGTALLPSSLRRLGAIDHARLPVVEAGVRLGPCVDRAGKVVVVEGNALHLLAPTALSGARDDVVLPEGMAVRCALRLGVVIGQPGRRLAVRQALAHVAGYCVLGEIRPEQASRQHGDTFAPLGPWLVVEPAVEADRDAVARAVAFASECMTLLPGDVLSLPPPRAHAAHPLAIGESRRIGIEGLGEQHFRAVALRLENRSEEQQT
ncbi:Ureidoglycolate lyase [Variovorax sp. PBS-H4]|uniref:fumarylacetoacetate hydrolase family protein n=1 Tax=Variovorax sp. PBS-H4 TaxID=434008 RepID=UPI001318FBAF|nr:fumarylacetoacetate hydrolase family protein [Variovorax sp. PBS-H4]VTU29869.1 Ureidoglycolate lyase [Variovorax sp. PBS-H4]